MQIESQVMAEQVQTRNGIEYVTVTCMERGASPLLQMFDYTLRDEEKEHKGKLIGKNVLLKVNTIRAIFSGRPQMSGSLALLAK
jgi:hypothetical protein